jgi:CRISPR-associated protein Cst2
MGKVIQISVLGKISGNVNADETIGNRATLKKMYSSTGEVLPFISARSIKYAILQAFKENNFEIDPFIANEKATEQLRLSDSGNPHKYIDNDLFGYMLTTSASEDQKGQAYKRQAPIAISYFKALRDTPIKSEFAARFPRAGSEGSNPVPFEIEIAEFIGRLNILIYDYVGDYTKSTRLKPDHKIEREEEEVRLSRLSAFLDILLTPSYVLARRTNSLSIPEYFGALICLSRKGPLPIYQYLDYDKPDTETTRLSTKQLDALVSREDIKSKIDGGFVELYLIDYSQLLSSAKNKIPNKIKIISLSDIIEKSCTFLFGGSEHVNIEVSKKRKREK